MICVHNPRLCYHLSSVIGSLGPIIVFGYKGILLIFGIFLTYQTQSVKLKQVSDSSYKGQDCRTLCGVLPLPQAHEGEFSILILYRCLFRRQCLVRRPVICWFGPISPMCGRICLTGKGGEGGESCIQQGLFSL